MKRLRVGIDNYGLHPLKLSPLETLEWADAHGAEGVQFSGISAEEGHPLDSAALDDIRDFARSAGLYLEWGGGRHIPFDLESGRPLDIFSLNLRAAEEARRLETQVIRSCSGGLMRWNADSPSTDTYIRAMAEALKAQRLMLADHGVTLAIETHFEFTTFELLRLFEMCGAEPGGWLGICLDTMNLLTMLEDPAAAVERILPWVAATHIKDGGIILGCEGLMSFPAEIGTGVIDLAWIIGRLKTLPREIRLSVEDHAGRFSLPVFDDDFRSRFPDLLLSEFIELTRLAARTRRKMDKGGLAIVPRERWPEICEARLNRDIQALRTLASRA